MRLHIRLKGLEFSDSEQKLLLKRTGRLEKRLARFDPELVDLELVLEKQPRRREYRSRTRLVVMNRSLEARRNAAAEVRTLITQVFEDLEEQLDALVAGLRGEAEWQRKRGMRSDRDLQHMSRQIEEERALLTEALTGDRASFDELAERRLAGVRKVILGLLSDSGREPSAAELDSALQRTLSRAFETLGRKPERWSLHGWLAHTARRELRRSARTARP